jgi:phage-related protein
MGKGLYEIRTNLEKKITRVLFSVEGDKMILLHGFVEKTKKLRKRIWIWRLKDKVSLETKISSKV